MITIREKKTTNNQDIYIFKLMATNIIPELNIIINVCVVIVNNDGMSVIANLYIIINIVEKKHIITKVFSGS